MFMYGSIMLILFILSNLLISLNRKHLLSLLLSLEFIMLILMLFMVVYFSNIQNEYYFLMVFMVMMVCEGVLGISILVLMVRFYGNDYFQLFSVMEC
uniref:NADH dehydrogenase subunit 4L n=1 Tax=Arctopsyche spinescens TaxID=2973067 RepID=UPI0022387A19|nr:NADH dehydrogenase subunit 4L [Arctopsyche spinescens]UYO79366.1 NADH dehydrogenase subunit 4L [Arctopsyche spinescens]